MLKHVLLRQPLQLAHMANPHRRSRRCPGCGSRLLETWRRCEMCGESVPWRLTPLGMRAETLAAVVVLLAVAIGLVGLRRQAGPGLRADEAQIAVLPVESPTSVPTFTPLPRATLTLQPNTPIPPTATPLPAVISYTVRSGNTLSGIAQEYGLSTSAVLAANEGVLSSPHDLRIGQVLQIPVSQAAAAVPDESVVEEPGQQPPDSGEPAMAATEPLPAALTTVLGLPTPRADGSLAPDPTTLVVPAGKDSVAVVIDDERAGAVAFPAPVAVSPAPGATVAGEGLVLRWSSSGILPAGVHYVVAITDASSGETRQVWVMTNATAVKVPGELRPPLGSSRTYTWSVSVRRRSGRIVGTDLGELRSPASEPRQFVWSP